MKVSKKAYYGFRAVLVLAQTQEPLSIHALAENESLPEEYLEKILQSLRRAGIVEAKKGVSGGYVLARPAKCITLWDILRVLDGPLKTFIPATGILPCLKPSHCQVNDVWRRLETEIEKTLTKITLASLIPNIHSH